MTPSTFIEICAAMCGVLGTFLLARNGSWAGWGFMAYLVSNAGWITFALDHHHWGLLTQQLAFTATSVYGVWKWLLEPALDRACDRLLDRLW